MDHFHGKSSFHFKFPKVCPKKFSWSRGRGPSLRMKGDSTGTVPTVAEELGMEELYEHDEVVGEEGPAAKAEAEQGDHQGSCGLTLFRSNNLGRRNHTDGPDIAV